MHSTGHDGVGLSSHFYSLFASFAFAGMRRMRAKKTLHTFVRFEHGGGDGGSEKSVAYFCAI